MRKFHGRLPRVSIWAAALVLVAVCASAGIASGLKSGGAEVAASADRPPLDPVLEGAGWIDMATGSPDVADQPERQGLRFPAGTSYESALNQIYVSAFERGTVPDGAELVEPLPVGVVTEESAAGALTISLVAPWGYDERTGAIRPPSFNLPGTLSPQEATDRVREATAAGVALPEGARVDVPELADCQAMADGVAPPPCAALEGKVTR